MCCEETKETEQVAPRPIPRVIGWRAWYADGSEYSSRHVDWSELPDDGLLVRKVFFSDGTNRMDSGAQGEGWYFVAPGNDGHFIYGFSMAESETRAEILKRYPGAILKRGKWIDDPTMHRVEREAMDAKV